MRINKQIKNTIRGLIFMLYAMGLNLYAQHDVNFNQYMSYQPLFNFSSASSYTGINAALFNRNQWVGVDGAPVSYAFSAMLPIDMYSSRVGVSVLKEKIGIHDRAEVSLGYAYSFELNKKSSMSFSVSPTIRLNNSRYGDLNVEDVDDNQFQQNINMNAIDFKFGSYYYTENFYAGLAIPNLLSGNSIFSNGSTTVDNSIDFSKMIFFAHVGYRFTLDQKNKLFLSSVIKETSGSPLHVDVNSMWEYASVFGIGLGYRSSKDMVGFVRVHINSNLMLSYAYQTPFAKTSGFKNSHEMMLVASFGKKLKRYKVTTPRF